MTDEELYGVAERWSYPVDRGDCEDYVLLKRRILMDAGWDPAALLITVVRDLKGAGHAVLTVVTDRGDFVLDNQQDGVMPWQSTGYSFVKRQSQSDPKSWVFVGPGNAEGGVASTRW
jgi:predicted transglutaminase-like cysteine proteinase